jgi:hypothetical protein
MGRSRLAPTGFTGLERYDLRPAQTALRGWRHGVRSRSPWAHDCDRGKAGSLVKATRLPVGLTLEFGLLPP